MLVKRTVGLRHEHHPVKYDAWRAWLQRVDDPLHRSVRFVPNRPLEAADRPGDESAASSSIGRRSARGLRGAAPAKTVGRTNLDLVTPFASAAEAEETPAARKRIAGYLDLWICALANPAAPPLQRGGAPSVDALVSRTAPSSTGSGNDHGLAYRHPGRDEDGLRSTCSRLRRGRLRGAFRAPCGSRRRARACDPTQVMLRSLELAPARGLRALGDRPGSARMGTDHRGGTRNAGRGTDPAAGRFVPRHRTLRRPRGSDDRASRWL